MQTLTLVKIGTWVPQRTLKRREEEAEEEEEEEEEEAWECLVEVEVELSWTIVSWLQR